MSIIHSQRNPIVQVRPLSLNWYTNTIHLKSKTFIVLYHKIYNGKPECNSKKHTITKDQVEQIVSMMNSNDINDINDVNIAIKIMQKANCTQEYDDIIWKLIKSKPSGIKNDYTHSNPKWEQLTSRDGVNKRILRKNI